jgi:RHS repeat-associated protein
MTSSITGTNTYTVTYDAENRLKEVKRNGVVIASFGYDGNGQMVTATVGVTTTYYVGNYFERVNGITHTYYCHAGKRIAMREGSTLYWLLSDHLGSTAMVVKATGPITGQLRYKAYGEARDAWGITDTTKYHFTGQREESTIGLYYYSSRWYDAALGRFVQADTLVPEPGNPQALNRQGKTVEDSCAETWNNEGLKSSRQPRTTDSWMKRPLPAGTARWIEAL